MILGQELSRFLRERRQKAKKTCGPGRIYCIACRAPKVPAGKMAECMPSGRLAGNLCGICPDCDRLIYRRVNLAKIDAIRDDLEITFTQPRPSFIDVSRSGHGSTLWIKIRKKIVRSRELKFGGFIRVRNYLRTIISRINIATVLESAT